MPIKKYVTTTSFKPREGRTITLPAGCTSVLYVFSDRRRAIEINGSDDLVELTESQKNSVVLTVDPKTGVTQTARTD